MDRDSKFDKLADKCEYLKDKKDEDNLEKESSKLEELCDKILYSSIPKKERKLYVWKRVNTINQNYSRDVIYRWRDTLKFAKGDDLNDLIWLLLELVKYNKTESIQRLMTCATLYNEGYLQYCYTGYKMLVNEEDYDIKHKLDAIKFLYGTKTHENVSLCEDLLNDYILNNTQHTSTEKFQTLKSFDSRKGIKTTMNTNKLRVGIDEDFLSGLYTLYFEQQNFDIVYRILSAQRLLQMECIKEDKDARRNIMDELFKIARNDTLREDNRANASDVILRLGTKAESNLARQLIRELGRSADGEKKKISPLTIYENSQNVHDENIEEYAEKFILSIFETTSSSLEEDNDEERNLEDVLDKLEEHLRFNEFIPKFKHVYRLSINRLKEDTSTFTKLEVTLSEILIHAWNRIIKEPLEEIRNGAIKRLIEEIHDVEGKCSSGYATVMVNVLSEIDDNIKMDIAPQIQANIIARINTAMKNAEDSIKETIVIGSMEGSTQKEYDVYVNFVKENLIKLREELYKEFVEGGYAKEDVFNHNFQEVKESYDDQFLTLKENIVEDSESEDDTQEDTKEI